MKFTKLVVAYFCVLVATTDGSLITNFISTASNFWPKIKELSNGNEVKKLPDVRFEVPIENEDFLKEGLALIGAPREALDLCTHRVIMTLKKNCNQLSLEESGKLAVMMLNCQLEIEGRTTFPCKPEMTLQQCTMGMNEEMHKIYNYMAHRAVGVCSALKNEQFRALTEMTVNRLMETAQSQAASMNEGMKNQRRLNEMTIENLKEFSELDGKIKVSQSESLTKLKHVGDIIEENIATLQHELVLRQLSEEKLSEIDKTTEEIAYKLVQHSSDIQDEHLKLRKEVDEISANLQKTNLEIVDQYNQALEFLNNFKSVMLVLSNIATNIKTYADRIFATIHDVGLELSDEFITFMFLNILYTTCGMIFMLFINAKGSCKTLLIILFGFNSVASYYKAEVPLFPLNIFVWTCFSALKLLKALKQRVGPIKINFGLSKYLRFSKLSKSDESEEEDDDSPRKRSVTPINARATNLKPDNHNGNVRSSPPKVKITANNPQAPKNYFNPIHHKNSIDDDAEMSEIFSRSATPANLSRPMTPAMRRVMNDSSTPQPDRSGTPYEKSMTGRLQCESKTAKGLRCRNASIAGLFKCRVHSY